MRAAPDDAHPRLVYADWLLERGDERGELILLEHHERAAPEGLTDPVALERLLILAAEHGFLRLPDDPDADVLPFHGGGSFPVQYRLDAYQGHNYYLRYRHGSFSITIDDDHQTEVYPELDVSGDGEWTVEETNVILAIVSQAIRDGTPLGELVFPAGDDMRAHSHYRTGRCPTYCFPTGFQNELSLDARDHGRWYALWARLQRLTTDPTPA